MAFGWGQKNLSPIGVDFGHDTVKLLQVQMDDPPQLVAGASLRVPDEARQSAEAYYRFVSESLGEVVRSGGFKGRRAIASIGAAHSFVHHLRLPKADGDLFQQQMEAELRGRLPQTGGGLVIRHVVAGEVVIDGSAKQEVICMAVGRDRVMGMIQSAKAAGLDVVGVHSEPMALVAGFGHLFQRKEDAGIQTMIVDIGAGTTMVVVAHGREMAFAKTVRVGGDDIAKEMSEAMGVSLDEARARRVAECENGVADSQKPGTVVAQPSRRAESVAVGGEGEDAGEGGGTATLEAQADDEVVGSLIDELRLCMGYHASTFTDKPIGKVVFVGGESRHLGLCRRVAESLGLPAQLGDPLARLVKAGGGESGGGLDLRRRQPSWSVSMGLCQLPSNL